MILRRVSSRQDNVVARVRLRVGISTRNRDHANHSQNSIVWRPATVAPQLQSDCTQLPGSAIHGR